MVAFHGWCLLLDLEHYAFCCSYNTQKYSIHHKIYRNNADGALNSPRRNSYPRGRNRPRNCFPYDSNDSDGDVYLYQGYSRSDKFDKSKKHASQKVFMLRNISLATAAVSLFSLQRSMLVSFEGMTALEIQIMNAATGSAVCVAVFVLGINLLQKRYEK